MFQDCAGHPKCAGLKEGDATPPPDTPKQYFFDKQREKKKTKKRICQSPKGSGAVAVKVVGHFFGVGYAGGKKMNTPNGLDLDSHRVGGLVGNCLFLQILFFVYINIYTLKKTLSFPLQALFPM